MTIKRTRRVTMHKLSSKNIFGLKQYNSKHLTGSYWKVLVFYCIYLWYYFFSDDNVASNTTAAASLLSCDKCPPTPEEHTYAMINLNAMEISNR